MYCVKRAVGHIIAKKAYFIKNIKKNLQTAILHRTFHVYYPRTEICIEKIVTKEWDVAIWRYRSAK